MALFCGLPWVALAHAGEVIIYPGNGVPEVIFVGLGAYPDSIAPSASSPSGNSVFISGGGSIDNVFGGYSSNGDVTGNSVSISGGNVVLHVYSGFTDSGNAVGNSITISGGTFGGAGSNGARCEVYGGNTNNGDAVGNSITITGGHVKANGIYGGYANSPAGSGARAVGNSVFISGGYIDATAIYGGLAGGADSIAENNSITIVGSPTFSSSTNLSGASGTTMRNNTLNFFISGVTLNQVENFQHYNFALPTDGGTALTARTIANIGASTTIAVPFAPSGTALNVGYKATLLQSPLVANEAAAWNGQKGQTRQGVSLLYDYTLSSGSNATGFSTSVTITGVQAAPESKALSESRAASMGFANLGADLVAGAGLANARAASAAVSGLSGGDSSATWGLAPFFALSASNLRYNSGSHTHVSGVALMGGLAKKWELSAADVLAGAFFEAAFGGYQAHNSFGGGSPASVDGKGDTKTVGGGILARVDLTDTVLKGLYAEASFRIGSLTSDYQSNDLRDFMGNAAGYDNATSTYYGAHAGLGYIWNFNESAALDVYAKYFWTHQTGQDMTILGDDFSFKAVDSQRVKLGGRFSYAVSETLTPYIGAAWEYEFDGKARATTYGYDVPAPSLKGSTGVGEVGLTWKPEKAQGFSVDLAMQGYTGQREGVSGSLLLKYEF